MARTKKDNEGRLSVSQVQELFSSTEQQKLGQDTTPMMRTTRNVAKVMQDGYRQSKKAIQLSLFDDLPEQVQKAVRASGTEVSGLYIGADLDGAGWRMVEALQKLQHLKSETRDQNSPAYYMGNYQSKGENDKLLLPISMGNNAAGAVVAVRPTIETNITELAAIYSCTKKPSNVAIESTRETLLRYSKQNYLMSYKEYYTEQYTDKKGNTKERRMSREIKGYMPLYSAIEDTTRDENENVTGRKLVIQLNPAFRRQIATNYDTKPLDYLERVTAASKTIWKRQMPDALLPFLNRLVDAQHYTEKNGVPERTYHIKQSELLEMIAPKEVKKRENKKAAEKLAGFIHVAESIGLLARHWEAKSKEDGSTICYFQVVDAHGWK